MNTTSIRKEIEDRNFAGRVFSVSPLSGGIVNGTWRVTAEKGEFVFQMIRDDLGGITAEDYLLLSHILRKSAPIPVLIDYWSDKNGERRIFRFIPNDSPSVPSGTHAAIAARHLGKTHEALRGSSWRPSRTIPGFHETDRIFSRLSALTGRSNSGEADRLAETILRESSRLLMPEYPEQLIHGDPKWKNFLFGHEAFPVFARVTIIDWDTLMHGNPLIDLGDFCRSFCFKAGQFDTDAFALACANYWMEGQPDTDTALQATKIVTLELGARYLIDWHEDSYFGWDQRRFASRKESNIAAARKYISYFQSIAECSL
ncbi:MAG TPA: phosphotransferase [Candidatus Paceibacterota bacterium]|nr:phosphotransferase [Candidatus Paceibacterota bacterium]